MSLPAEAGTRRRLFFALWPDEAVREQLHQASRVLTRDKRGKVVSQANLHITLAFLGSVETGTAQCLIQQADALVLPGFSLTLDRAGYWTGPRVLWLGCEQTPVPLQALVGSLQQLQRLCGLEPESRPFHTHLTVMRKLAPHGVTFPAFEPVAWPVASFALVASDTRPEGAVYSVVKSWPLQG